MNQFELLSESVKRGVALLDNFMPNWRQHINLDTLCLANDVNCIVGQLAQYSDSPDFKNLAFNSYYGFCIPFKERFGECGTQERRQYWNFLQNEWVKHIGV